MSNKDFAQEIEQLLEEAAASINSALLSDEFMISFKQAIGEIPNLVGAHTQQEQDANSSDAS
jgi:hypothetical protein